MPESANRDYGLPYGQRGTQVQNQGQHDHGPHRTEQGLGIADKKRSQTQGPQGMETVGGTEAVEGGAPAGGDVFRQDQVVESVVLEAGQEVVGLAEQNQPKNQGYSHQSRQRRQDQEPFPVAGESVFHCHHRPWVL